MIWPEVGRIAKIFAQVRVALLWINFTQLKSSYMGSYSSKSKKVHGENLTWETVKTCSLVYISLQQGKIHNTYIQTDFT